MLIKLFEYQLGYLHIILGICNINYVIRILIRAIRFVGHLDIN